MSLLELLEYTLKFNLAAPATATWIYMLLIAVFVVLDLAGGNPARIVHRLVSLESSLSPKIYA
jgi:hypothetical protein